MLCPLAQVTRRWRVATRHVDGRFQPHSLATQLRVDAIINLVQSERTAEFFRSPVCMRCRRNACWCQHAPSSHDMYTVLVSISKRDSYDILQHLNEYVAIEMKASASLLTQLLACAGVVELLHEEESVIMRGLSFAVWTASCCVSLALGAISPRSRALLNGINAEVSNVSEDLIGRCEKKWFTTNLDHFSRSVGPDGQDSFQLRYYVCDHAHRHASEDGPAGPIFFYLGNEANVLLYINATGLMWENAEKFGAMLVFAEHRYYGESLPFGEDTFKHMQWLTTEQALADYASLIYDLKTSKGLQDVPVIGFGGSYGGMLGAWGRLKYPHTWHGVIAGSAPIWAFDGEDPPIDPNYFAKGVTYDTSIAAGAAPGCTATLRAAWQALISLADRDDGVAKASAALNICPHRTLNTTDDVYSARGWAASAFDMMAMGNYPFESGYMLNGNGYLPPFPVRVACQALMDSYNGAQPLSPFQPSGAAAGAAGRRLLVEEDTLPTRMSGSRPGVSAGDRQSAGHGHAAAAAAAGTAQAAGVRDGGSADDAHSDADGAAAEAEEVALVRAMAVSIAVWFNYTGDVMCYDPWKGVNDETQHIANMWDYQFCTEMWMPHGRDGITDVFWSEPWDAEATRQSCKREWGVQPRPLWATVEWGGRRLESLSNVVFSNGLYDPWHGGGVLTSLSDTVKAVIIPNGAHHLDLMFSHENDPDTVKAAREEELDSIRDWIDDFHAARTAQQAA
eukprot:jgi/Ulvmu1/11402/UM075_0064.1